MLWHLKAVNSKRQKTASEDIATGLNDVSGGSAADCVISYRATIPHLLRLPVV